MPQLSGFDLLFCTLYSAPNYVVLAQIMPVFTQTIFYAEFDNKMEYVGVTRPKQQFDYFRMTYVLWISLDDDEKITVLKSLREWEPTLSTTESKRWEEASVLLRV